MAETVEETAVETAAAATPVSRLCLCEQYVRVTEGAAVPLLQRFAPTYLGPKADFPPASMRDMNATRPRPTPLPPDR